VLFAAKGSRIAYRGKLILDATFQVCIVVEGHRCLPGGFYTFVAAELGDTILSAILGTLRAFHAQGPSRWFCARHQAASQHAHTGCLSLIIHNANSDYSYASLNSRHEWQQHSSWGFMIRQGHMADAYNVYQKPVRNALFY